MLWKTPREPGRAAEVAFVVGVCHRTASKGPGYSLTTMGLSGHDNHQGQQSGMPEWHRLLSCLAICALLIQSIVPELAMTAREAMARLKVSIGTSEGLANSRVPAADEESGSDVVRWSAGIPAGQKLLHHDRRGAANYQPVE
jgi:hypothetical protein